MRLIGGSLPPERNSLAVFRLLSVRFVMSSRLGRGVGAASVEYGVES